jgi:hypothetical protein
MLTLQGFEAGPRQSLDLLPRAEESDRQMFGQVKSARRASAIWEFWLHAGGLSLGIEGGKSTQGQ